MAQEYPGFLTESQRKYLRGDKDISEHSNPSVVRGRIRHRLSGMLEDLKLVQESKFMNGDNLAKTTFGTENYQQLGRQGLETDQVETGMASAKGISQLYGGEFIQNLTDTLEELEVDGDLNNEDDLTEAVQELYVENVIGVMVDSMDAYGVDEEPVIRDFIRNVWPEKDKALEIMESVLDDK